MFTVTISRMAYYMAHHATIVKLAFIVTFIFIDITHKYYVLIIQYPRCAVVIILIRKMFTRAHAPDGCHKLKLNTHPDTNQEVSRRQDTEIQKYYTVYSGTKL